jgi:hypothetical protein
MIKIKRDEDSKDTMNISIVGDAEDIAKEYAALTLKLMREYGPILDRAMDYVKCVMAEQ